LADLSVAISKALSEGFQVEANAFQFLSNLSSEVDPESLVADVIRRKKIEGQSTMITRSDLQDIVPEDLFAPDEAVQQVFGQAGDLEVLSDPTTQIAPLEADVGFKKLFQDRYWR